MGTGFVKDQLQGSTLRVAVIGCGRMGHAHSERIAGDPRAEVVALFDAHAEVATKLQQTHAQSAEICHTFEELLSRDDIDAAIICTPTTLHHEQVQACFAQGWHLLCEKPLAESRERILDLIELVEGSGDAEDQPLCMLGYQRRFWATYRTIRREVASGRWGAVRAVTSHNVERWEQTIAGTWRDDPAINIGGFVGDAGSHKIDALFYTTGLRPTSIFARSDTSQRRVEVVTTVSAVLEDRVPLAMDFIGHAQYLGEDLHVHCSEADLMIRDRKAWIARAGTIEPLEPLEPDSNPTIGFLDVLSGKFENPAPFSVALPVWDMTQAVLASSRKGTVIDM